MTADLQFPMILVITYFIDNNSMTRFKRVHNEDEILAFCFKFSEYSFVIRKVNFPFVVR
jgi:hypothetical protein